MKAKHWIFLAPLLCACGTEQPRSELQTLTITTWNEAATQDARAQVEAMMNAFAAMDLQRFEAGLAHEVVGFELDLENKPVRLGSRSEVMSWVSGIVEELKKMGATIQLDVHASECHATPTLAYAAVEFDLIVTMPDGAKTTQPTRNTIVLRRETDGWRWAHWHSSLSAGLEIASEPPRR